MIAETSKRRRVPRSVWWLTVGWLAVTVGAVLWGVPHEERNLTERAEAALAGQPVAVEFDGRDAAILGQVGGPADIDRAAATVRAVRGVRRVSTNGVTVAASDVPSTQAPELASPSLSLTILAGSVTLAGTVPDQATVDAVVQVAETRWGADNVTNLLVIDDATSGAAWLPGIVSAIDGLSVLRDGSITVGPDGAVITGAVGTPEESTAVEAAVTTALGAGTVVTNQLQVVALAPPSFEAELLESGSVRLRGVMPDQETIDAIFAGAAGVYGSGSVVNEMSVGSNIGSPSYLESLPAIFGTIDGLNPWRVSVEAGAATIDGLAVSEAAIEETVGRLTTALGAGDLSLANQLQVDPGAVAVVLTELLEGTATFQVGSATLSDEATGLLDEAIEILQANPTTILTVEGHTDDVGSEENNLALSESRAQAVVDYLVAGGVAAERLTAAGFGESRPIADNNTADGRSQNRRIEFVVEQGDN